MNAPLSRDVRIAAEVAAQIEDAGITADDPDYGKLLDGECELNDRLRRMWRAARYAERLGEEAKRIAAETEAAAARHEARAERLKALVLWAMQETAQRRLEACDFVLSVAQGKAPLLVECDPASLPDDLVRTKREANKSAIRAALDEGREIAGCRLGNAAPYIAARSR